MDETQSATAEASELPSPLPFDEFAQEIYLQEVLRRCGRGMRAAKRLDKAVALLMQQRNPGGPSLTGDERERIHSSAFENSEMIVSEAAMLAQLLWPDIRKGPGETPEECRRRKAYGEARGVKLCQILGVADESPIRAKALRNSIQHFDERLDAVTMNPPRIFLRNNIGPTDMFNGIKGAEGMHLHHFDPADGRYTILGDSVALPDVVRELKVIYDRSQEGLQRLHESRWSSRVPMASSVAQGQAPGGWLGNQSGHMGALGT